MILIYSRGYPTALQVTAQDAHNYTSGYLISGVNSCKSTIRDDDVTLER